MTYSYRRIESEQEEETFEDFWQYSIPPMISYMEEQEARSIIPPRVQSEKYGLFDGGDMIAAITHHPIRMRVRGEWVDATGSSIAVHPNHRTSGTTEAVLSESYEELRREGVNLLCGLPFVRGFYDQYGATTIGRFARAKGRVTALPSLSKEGDVRIIDGDEYGLLDDVYRTFASDYDLVVDRTEDWWRDVFFLDPEELDIEGIEEDRPVAVLEADEPRAYMKYVIDRGTFFVEEVAYKSHEDWIQLLDFIGRHYSQALKFHMLLPTDVPVLDVVSEAIDYETELAHVGRIVDVEQAIESISFGDLDMSITVRVDDSARSITAWNDDTFSVTVRDGRAAVERTEEEWDARVGIGTLTQLFTGYFSASEAASMGSLETRNGEAMDALEELFPKRNIWISDLF